MPPASHTPMPLSNLVNRIAAAPRRLPRLSRLSRLSSTFSPVSPFPPQISPLSTTTAHLSREPFFMHEAKRQRTRSPSPQHRPNYTSGEHRRSPSTKHHNSYNNSHNNGHGHNHAHTHTQRQSKRVESPFPRRGPFFASDELRNSTVPKGLFASGAQVFPAKPFNKSYNNRAHYFLFESKRDAKNATDSAADSTTTTSTTANPTSLPKRVVSPMLNYVQILTTPTADTPGTCLMVHHDSRRYFFGNIAEGTQRVCVQQKMSLSRVDEIFLTGTMGWHTAGGLLGMVLTVAEVVQSARGAAIEEARDKVNRMASLRHPQSTENSIENDKKSKAAVNAEMVYQAAVKSLKEAENVPARSLSIHGGANLAHLIATSRRFIFRKGMPLKPHEVRDDTSLVGTTDADTMRDPDWSDDNIMVWYVPVFAEAEAEAECEGEGEGEAAEAVEPSRKRALEGEGEAEAEAAAPLDEATALEVVSNVVRNMFDSDWSLDALVETTLHKAKLPAKLFVKGEDGHLKEYDGPLPTKDGNSNNDDIPNIPVLVRQPWPATMIESLPPTKPVRQSMCYIVRNHPRRGKFDAAAATKLGVAKVDCKHLVAGRNVTTADGTVVTPEMVVAGDVEGSAFAVVELPDSSYIDPFLAKPEWTNIKTMDAIDTMFWLLGPGVVADPRVQAFMKQHSNIRHTVSSTDTCPNRLSLSSTAVLQAQHNRIDPPRFPIQKFDNAEPPAGVAPVVEAEAETKKPLYVPARAGWSVRLAPQVMEDEGKVFGDVDFVHALSTTDRRVVNLADRARAKTEQIDFQTAADLANESLPHPDTEVIPLGTGSAIPSKYRNVSATLLRVPGVGSYLFDCGENTLGSMRRLFGEEKLQEVLRDLKVLWISHLHADHHLGTVSVLRAFRDANLDKPNKKIMVASHIHMIHWMREYSGVQDFGFDRVFQVTLDAPRFPHGSAICEPRIFTASQQAEFGLERIDAVRVEHCHGALATVFTWPVAISSLISDGEGALPLKIAYSGDCRPSHDFGTIGQDTTLLIHESTFDDELQGEARAKKHSTMGEALAVGRHMKARRVLLTHFSQRYPKIPIFNNDSEAEDAKSEMQILVAFDQMQVKLKDFKVAAEYLPALQKLYEGEEYQGKKAGDDNNNKNNNKQKQKDNSNKQKDNNNKQKGNNNKQKDNNNKQKEIRDTKDKMTNWG